MIASIAFSNKKKIEKPDIFNDRLTEKTLDILINEKYLERWKASIISSLTSLIMKTV